MDISWEDLPKYLPPSQVLAQYSPLASTKTILTFRLPISVGEIKKRAIEWVLIRRKAVETYNSLGFPYDSASLAIGPLTQMVREEVEGWMTFGLPGPIILSLRNTCCEEEVCALRKFFECVIDNLLYSKC